MLSDWPSAGEALSPKDGGRIFGVMVTYRRQKILKDSLLAIFQQSRTPDCLIVVDNEASDETHQVVEAFNHRFSTAIVYLRTPANLGSAGGWHVGFQWVLTKGCDRDWILPLDDDDPPQSNNELEEIHSFAEEQRKQDSQLGAVGIVGARFNWWIGRNRRVPDHELQGAVPVDWLGNGHLPLYSFAAVKAVGLFRSEFFFGHTEVEYGLRMRRAGYLLFAHGDQWKERRKRSRRTGIKAHVRTPSNSYRRYLVHRNLVAMFRQFHRPDLILWHLLLRGLLRPLIKCRRSLKAFWHEVKMVWTSAWDGLMLTPTSSHKAPLTISASSPETVQPVPDSVKSVL